MQSWLHTLGAMEGAGPGATYPRQHDALAAAAADGDALCVLDNLALVRVSGPDARSFLQAQLTVDVTDVGTDRLVPAAWCTPAGRVTAVVTALPLGEDVVLLTHASLAAALVARMKMYVLRARVTLEADASCPLLGVIGDGPADALARALGCPLPAEGVVQAADAALAAMAGQRSRWVLIAREDVLEALCADLAGRVPVADAAPWDWLDTVSGIPTVTAATTGHFLPQELNLDVLGGLDFRKGCYPGQEVIARLHYRGRPAHRMALAHAPRPAQPGQAVIAAGETEPHGEVVRSAAAPAGGASVLFTSSTRRSAAPALCLDGDPGQRLTLQALPYAVPAPVGPARERR